MSDSASPREGHEGFIPYLIVSGAGEAMAFYGAAFGAKETMRLSMPDGSVAHAEMTVDGHPFYLADMSEDMADGPLRSPTATGATTVIMHRYVGDVDAAVAQARTAGATVLRAPEDQFYGDRTATVADPWGHQWSLHTRVRDVSMEEMEAVMSGEDPTT